MIYLNITNISKIDPSAFAANLDTALSSLDTAVKSMIGTKDKNGELIDETKALAIQYEKINNSINYNSPLVFWTEK